MHELLYEDELDVKDRHQRMVYVKYIIQKKEMEKLEHEVKKVEKVQVSTKLLSIYCNYISLELFIVYVFLLFYQH